jgi:putative inorganic carbon (HCO3(-)) transporter
MLFTLFITSIKNTLKKQNYITCALLLALVGYGIQAFFNISVIEVAPLFWITIGLLYNRKCKNLQK